MITENEIQIARETLRLSLEKGAEKARVNLYKSEEDMVVTLNGAIDRVTHCSDSSISFSLFVDGRYGSFSTNELDIDSLGDFITKAISITKMIAKDPCRDLPDPSRCCKDAVTGNELELLDPFYKEITPEMRSKTALGAAIFGSPAANGENYSVISEEGEYSDSIYDSVVMDTNGLFCRHSENSFDYGVEVTIESEGDKHTGYWWDSSSRYSELKAAECGLKAVRTAAGQIGSSPARNGKYNLVADSEVASKFVSSILRALNAYAIQQNNSFLADSLGKHIFPDGMTIIDVPRIKGQNCSRYFDSEGVEALEAPIIQSGTICRYFVNTYMSNKMHISPTIEDPSRPKLMPWPKAGLDRDAIMKMCGDGILVTDFNGGNCNSSSGDFSYGIEGFLFKDGRCVRPVSEMLVTGNVIKLWSNLIAAGDDARACMSKLIPTLAFSNVDFNG